MSRTYSEAIRDGFEWLLRNDPDVFVLGQGLWSPWYVGNSMKGLEKDFGKDRVVDTPVSEAAVTGAAVGAAISGMRPIVVHPRMDFMLYAVDQIVNQAAKWSHMMGGQRACCLTVRGIINRGGEQGAQHSQALHGMFSHIPGLRVVMPYTADDARDLLIASARCNDPVIYIDDRWLYDEVCKEEGCNVVRLEDVEPKVRLEGENLTMVGIGYGTRICLEAAGVLAKMGISAEVIDLRVVSPLKIGPIVDSVRKTSNILVIDVGWKSCSIGSEIIARVAMDDTIKVSGCGSIGLQEAPAPCSRVLEKEYYPTCKDAVEEAKRMLKL